MTERLARWLVQRSVAWAVVLTTALVALVCGAAALSVTQDDDVLAFLPDSHPDIRAFREINERFGSTDVALVGIATPDPFAPGFVARLQALSRDLRDVPGLDSSLTLTSVSDFVADPDGGIVTSELIQRPPADAAEQEALRAKVMSRDHIVGTLVSEDADAVLVLAFAAPGAQPREVAGRIREAVQRHFPDEPVYWGGAPFISTWIYETTQADMAALTPWAVAAIVLIMLLAFRDLLGTFLGLVATGVGIAVSRAVMAALGVQFNIVLSSMPVILFALGSAYAIHILSHYDHHARKVGERPEAVVRTLVGTGPTVLAAGLTTVAGLLSFVMMDIAPMQVFGWFTALGLLVALLVSLTFVPAVIALWPRPVRARGEGAWTRGMVRLVRASRERRLATFVVLLGVAGLALSSAGLVRTRMDLRAFFDAGTEPWVAQAFLDEHFGGSQFVQIEVAGDLEEPEVLRELGRIGDRIERVPLVSSVQSIEDVVGIIADAMSGARRVPDHRGQVAVLYRFLASDPTVARLVTDERAHALVQVKIASSDAAELDAVLAEVRRIVAASAVTRYRIVPRDEAPDAVAARIADVVTERVLALAHAYRVPLADDAEARVRAWLEAPTAEAGDAGPAVAAELEAFLGSEESFVPLVPAQAAAVADAVAALGPDPDGAALEGAVTAALQGDDATVQDLLVVLDQPLVDAWRRAVADARARALLAAVGAEVPRTDAGARFVAAVGAKLQDLDGPAGLLPSDAPDAATLTWTVNGMPVLYQGLAESVEANQIKSLAFALGLVWLIMAVYYRSPSTGLLATAPTFLTLAVVYGGMGALGVSLDIGTSMLASLIIGAGVDYAVHLLATWDAGPDDDLTVAAVRSVRENSHAIWTNAVMVAAGFFVLTLGDARPLKNVGGLTATAMIVAALSTFVVIPLFAHRARYRRQPSWPGEATAGSNDRAEARVSQAGP